MPLSVAMTIITGFFIVGMLMFVLPNPRPDGPSDVEFCGILVMVLMVVTAIAVLCLRGWML